MKQIQLVSASASPHRFFTACVALTLSACSGAVLPQDLAPGADPLLPKTLAEAPSSAEAQSSAAACAQGTSRETTRLIRITHAQYDNSVRMLTSLQLRPSLDFPADQNQAGFDRGIDLQVGEVLGQAYRSSAEQLALQVVTQAEAFAKVVGCDPNDGACANDFIMRFGRRAFRRPLSGAERDAYGALFTQAPALVDGTMRDFHKGVQLVVEAMLQSPNFLYRAELGEREEGGRVLLSGFELAARLSFALSDQSPSDALLDAAQAGALSDPDAVAEQARELLNLPEARSTVRAFHRQWLDLDALPNKLAKDPVKFPSVSPALAPLFAEESMRFAEAVTFDERRGYASLLLAPFAFVNRTTAALYGLSGDYGDELQRAELDRSQRAGILTQLAFLAGHAYTDQTSPIHRGVFVQRKMLCNTIPDPPANIPQPAALGPTQTTRQQIDTLTAVSPCNGCHHTLINPVGFAFEGFDAVGQFRTQENGAPIDASGKLAGTRAAGEGKGDFQDAVGASKLIAESIEGRRCFAATWLRYTFGRQEDGGEACLIDTLADRLADDGYTVVDLLVDLTRSPFFMSRATGGN